MINETILNITSIDFSFRDTYTEAELINNYCNFIQDDIFSIILKLTIILYFVYGLSILSGFFKDNKLLKDIKNISEYSLSIIICGGLTYLTGIVLVYNYDLVSDKFFKYFGYAIILFIIILTIIIYRLGYIDWNIGKVK